MSSRFRVLLEDQSSARSVSSIHHFTRCLFGRQLPAPTAIYARREALIAEIRNKLVEGTWTGNKETIFRGCYIAHFRGFIKSTFYQGFFGQGQCQKSESIAAAIWLELKWWSHHQQYSWELSQFQSISMSSPSPSQRSQLNQPTILHWQHWLQCSCIIIIASQFDPYIPGRALAFFYLNHVPDSP